MTKRKSEPGTKPRRKVPGKKKGPKPNAINVGKIATAYAYYYSLLETRSLKAVASKFKVSIGTVKRWSAEYDWRNEVASMDRDVSERVREGLVASAAARTVKHLEVLDRLTTRFIGVLDRTLIRKDKAGKSVTIEEAEAASLITDMDDYQKLVKLELLLLAIPTEILEDASRYVVISAVPSSKPQDPE